jgi:hypothetical protein
MNQSLNHFRPLRRRQNQVGDIFNLKGDWGLA